MSSIYLNSFWNDSIMYDEYCYVLLDLYLFTLYFFSSRSNARSFN